MKNKMIVDSHGAEDVSLKELFIKIQKLKSYIFSKWITILIFFVIGSALGFTYAMVKRPLFIATTTFVLEEADKGGGLGQYAGLASMVGIDVGSGGGGIFQGDNILELYKSRTMIEKTLFSTIEYEGNKYLLLDRYIEFNKLRQDWVKNPQLKNIQFKNRDVKLQDYNSIRLIDSILGVIVNDINKNYLKVSKPDKKLSIIKAEVKAPDELFAKAFNDKIVEKVNDFYIQTKTKRSLDNVNILQQKTDSVRGVMNGAIYTVAAVADATPNLNPTRQSQRQAPMQRSQFSAETNKAMLIELVKNLELSKISLRKEAPLIQVIDQPILPLYKDQLGKKSSAIIGGVIAVILTVMFFFTKKIFQNILK